MHATMQTRPHGDAIDPHAIDAPSLRHRRYIAAAKIDGRGHFGAVYDELTANYFDTIDDMVAHYRDAGDDLPAYAFATTVTGMASHDGFVPGRDVADRIDAHHAWAKPAKLFTYEPDFDIAILLAMVTTLKGYES